jgi:hypothetical protein
MRREPVARAALRALVADAARAPSSHNTQPWRFRLGADWVELHADRSRSLPVNDPDDRELVISCGAALENLAVSAARHGWKAMIEVRPRPQAARDHLATVTLGTGADRGRATLWPAIAVRRTHRAPFGERPVPPALTEELLAAAAGLGGWAQLVDRDRRDELAALVAEGARLQFGDPAWRRELAGWMRPRRAGDGLPVPAVAAVVTRTVVASFDLGARTARSDAALVRAAPLVVVLGTDDDDERSRLEAGRSLERLLLTAALDGVQAGFLNQPCQVPTLRPELSKLVELEHPQLVVRLGYPARTPAPSARRRVDAVLDS